MCSIKLGWGLNFSLFLAVSLRNFMILLCTCVLSSKIKWMMVPNLIFFFFEKQGKSASIVKQSDHGNEGQLSVPNTVLHARRLKKKIIMWSLSPKEHKCWWKKLVFKDSDSLCIMCYYSMVVKITHIHWAFFPIVRFFLYASHVFSHLILIKTFWKVSIWQVSQWIYKTCLSIDLFESIIMADVYKALGRFQLLPILIH